MIVRNLVKIMIQLKRKIGDIRVEPTYTTSKLPKHWHSQCKPLNCTRLQWWRVITQQY